MSQYESKARHHLERIGYYHENAGPRGYAQAKYHYNELAKLQMGVHYSKKYKNEAPIIASVLRQKSLYFDCHAGLDPESSISELDSRFRRNDGFVANVNKRWTHYTSFRKQAEPLMKEMEKWQDEWEKEE